MSSGWNVQSLPDHVVPLAPPARPLGGVSLTLNSRATVPFSASSSEIAPLI